MIYILHVAESHKTLAEESHMTLMYRLPSMTMLTSHILIPLLILHVIMYHEDSYPMQEGNNYIFYLQHLYTSGHGHHFAYQNILET